MGDLEHKDGIHTDRLTKAEYESLTEHIVTGGALNEFLIVQADGTLAHKTAVEVGVILGAIGGGVRVSTTRIAFDLSGADLDEVLFTPYAAGVLVGWRILYTETSSADAGVNVRVGKLTQAGVHDDDFYDIETSEVNKVAGYSKLMNGGDLLQTVIAVGETLTVGCAGSKVGAGEVIIVVFTQDS